MPPSLRRFHLATITFAVTLSGSCALILPREHVREGARVTLSFPSDNEGSKEYRWIQESGPTVEIQDEDSAEAWFVAPQSGENYRMVFARLSEKQGDAVSRQFGVYVIAKDDLPEVDAGETIFTGEGERVEFAGKATDPEGREVQYAWRQTAGPRVTLTDSDRSNSSFYTPQVTARTYLRFELAVTDFPHPATLDEVAVVVDPVDSIPTLFVDPDITTREGERVRLEAKGVDPEGAELAYVWSLRPGAPALELVDETGPTPNFVAPRCPAGVDSYTLTFDVTASDGANISQAERVVVTIVADEGVPVAKAGEDMKVREGERVRLMGRASHPEGRALSYAWRQTGGAVALQLEEEDTLTPIFSAPAVPEGKRVIEAVLELTVTDGEHRARDLVNVSIEPTYAPRLKRSALSPGEIDPLLVVEGGVLLRWIRAQLAAPDAGQGFFAAGEQSLEGRFFRSAGHLACDLPPGGWRLEGTLNLKTIDPRPDETQADGRGVTLRFETAEGEAAAFGIVTLGQKVGVQVRSLERDPFTGDWRVARETLNILEEIELESEVHFTATWKDLRLAFQWSQSSTAFSEQPDRVIELARAPELLTLRVERARAHVEELRLIGAVH